MAAKKCLVVVLLMLALCLSAAELPLPMVLEGERNGDTISYQLQAQNGRHRFYTGGREESTLGYNSSYLGPVIRVNRGDQARILVNNNLNETTTLHWHGMLVPSDVDGDMRQTISKNGSREVSFPILNYASTNWFHPHVMENTANQVYAGLAGLLYVDEPDNPVYQKLPQTYGVDDIPLVIQDKRFDSKGRVRWRWGGMMTRIMGRRGNTLLFNGIADAEFAVTSKLTRFRILNGANDSTFILSLSDGSPFQLIASDAGMLRQPIQLKELTISPSDRMEVVIDFSNYRAGQKVTLNARSYENRSYRGLPLLIGELSDRGTSVAQQLNPEMGADKQAPTGRITQRQIALETRSHGRGSTINGARFDLHRVDWRIPANTVEEWTVSNIASGMRTPHTLHLHGVHFEVVELNGRRPPPELGGLEDNIVVFPGETVRLKVYFPSIPGKYLYHCHLLEHEEDGMMSWFEIV